MSSKDAECEQAFQELQKLQDEIDTVREEVQFKQHCLEEREQQLEENRRALKSVELELQVIVPGPDLYACSLSLFTS